MQLPLEQWRMAQQLALWPVEEWPDGWMRFKTAMVLQRPDYLQMTEYERRISKLPVTRSDMLEFLKSRNAI